MEFEREFNKVDKALSAAALSAVIIHKQVCSHQDVATLESLVPGMIFDNQWAYGFTNEASLENFQKVKEVVGNAIKTAIAKIKELIKRFMDWIKGSKADDRKKIDVTIENANEAKRKFGALFVNPDTREYAIKKMREYYPDTFNATVMGSLVNLTDSDAVLDAVFNSSKFFSSNFASLGSSSIRDVLDIPSAILGHLLKHSVTRTNIDWLIDILKSSSGHKSNISILAGEIEKASSEFYNYSTIDKIRVFMGDFNFSKQQLTHETWNQLLETRLAWFTDKNERRAIKDVYTLPEIIRMFDSYIKTDAELMEGLKKTEGLVGELEKDLEIIKRYSESNPDVARAIAGIITLIRTYSAALSSVSKITSKYRSLLMTLRSDMEGIISKIGQILDKK